MKGLFKAKPRTPSELLRSSRELLVSIDLLPSPRDPKREEKILGIFVVVEELHDISAKEMNKILKDSNNHFTLLLKGGRGSSMRIDVERLVLALPLHLLACLASRGTELRLRYLLHGVRLLHSLSDLAVRHQKLEQLMLQEVKLREQILDLVIYMLITLAGNEQEGRLGSSALLHAALVACSLYLLPAFVATEWLDVVPVLLAHPMVNLFMDAAFDAVRRDIGLLQNKFRVLNSKLMNGKMTQAGAECVAQVIGQQCEASIQVLQSLCQPHAFRDKLLNHKELCRKGGLLRLAIAVLKLQLPYSFQESKYLTVLISRLQSKILSMLVKLCETEPVSFLDEVAIEPRTMHLAESVAGEVLALVQVALNEDSGRIQSSTVNLSPNPLLYINALHLADIFSDDSNFRNFVMDYITPDLTQVLLQAPTIFSSEWCGSQVDFDASKSGTDAVLVYDPFRAAGAAMQSFKGFLVSGSMPLSSSAPFADEYSGCALSSEQILPASYAPKRASLFVKIIANLHCFNPDICAADEKDRFLKIFLESLTKHAFNPSDKSFFLSTVQTAVRICENLLLLLEHVSCLPSEVVSDEDLQLVSTFYDALHDAICPGVSEPSFHEDPVVGYVRDAHEQKRRTIFAQRLQSERWRRIQRYSEVSDKEQSTSNNKTVTKPPANQQNLEDDTCQTSEEAQSKGNRSYTERQDLVDPGDETEEVQIINKMEEHATKEEMGAEWMDTEEIESRGLTESLVKIETWDRERTEVQSTRPIENTVEVDFFPRDLVIVQSTQPNIDEMKREKECWEKEGERGKPTVEGDQCDFTCTEISKYVQNEEAGDFKLENLEPLDASEDKNQIPIYTPLNDMKDEYTTDGKLEDIEIHSNALDIDYHEDTHKGLEEINVEKVENLIDNIDVKTDVDMGQESSHSMVGITRGGAESEIQPNDTHAIQKPLVTTLLGEEIQPKKRKRNIMNEKQMIVIENALKAEPDMQRYPKLIQQWTTQLNKIGPELSYQQLKNWLNNRKARLARQAREARGLEGETRVRVFEADCLSSLDLASQTKPVSRNCGNYSGSPSDHKNSMTEDGQVRESGSFTRTCMPGTIIGIFQSKHIEEDLGISCPMEFDSYYSHGCEFPDVTKVQGASRVSASVKFVKCEVGQYVSLLDTEGKEIAHGIVNQVDGKWEGKKLDEQGLCIVKISKLKVDKSMRLPYPSAQSGSTFEENEAFFGHILVAWDTSRIFLIS